MPDDARLFLAVLPRKEQLERRRVERRRVVPDHARLFLAVL